MLYAILMSNHFICNIIKHNDYIISDENKALYFNLNIILLYHLNVYYYTKIFYN